MKKWTILKKYKEKRTVFLPMDFYLISGINKEDANKEPDKELSKIIEILMTCQKTFFLGINARKKLGNRPILI